MSRILITGAPGWVGTRLVHLLIQEGEGDIRCLVKPDIDASTLSKSNQVTIIRGDLTNIDDIKRFCDGSQEATLFHCAGVIHPKLFVRDLYNVNVQGTMNLLQVAEDKGILRIIAISSNSPFGVNKQRDLLFDESSPYNPYMSYGRSKMIMEQVIHDYQARGHLETVVLRPTWFYGPCQPKRQTIFFQMIKNGKSPIVGDGENLRSMVYIDNLCQALLLSKNNPKISGQTYWIADKRPYQMKEIIDTIERLMEEEFGLKVAHKRLKLPNVVSDVAQLSDTFIQKVGLYQQKIHVLSEMNKTIACSIEKAQRELNYEPRIELEEGMRRSLAWCIEQGVIL